MIRTYPFSLFGFVACYWQGNTQKNENELKKVENDKGTKIMVGKIEKE
jgi:hypothetical protein